jgi:hypothetical protein
MPGTTQNEGPAEEENDALKQLSLALSEHLNFADDVRNLAFKIRRAIAEVESRRPITRKG